MISLFHRNHAIPVSSAKPLPSDAIVFAYEKNKYIIETGYAAKWWSVGIYLWGLCAELTFRVDDTFHLNLYLGERLG